MKQENEHPKYLEVQTAWPDAHGVELRMQQPVWNGRPHVAQLRTNCICSAVCCYTAADTVPAGVLRHEAANLAGRRKRLVKLCYPDERDSRTLSGLSLSLKLHGVT